MMTAERSARDEVVVLDLSEERSRATQAGPLQASGRSARTRLKDGALRVTLVALAPGGQIPEHRADGPITVQPLAGRIRFIAMGVGHDLGPGEMLSLRAGIPHVVESDEGAAFLLTLALPSATERAEPVATAK